MTYADTYVVMGHMINYKLSKRGMKMCFYIGIEDLAANALIEILEMEDENPSQKCVTYAELEKYGTEVVRYLKVNGEKAVLIFSKESTDVMLHNYSDFFEEREKGTAIGLREGKHVPDLIERFRAYLAFDLMMAFMADDPVKVLKGKNVRR